MVKANLCRTFLVCIYEYCLWRSSLIKVGMVGITLIGLTSPHICAFPKSEFVNSNVISRDFLVRLVKMRGDCSSC